VVEFVQLVLIMLLTAIFIALPVVAVVIVLPAVVAVVYPFKRCS
jgi:hypothetical protein